MTHLMTEIIMQKASVHSLLITGGGGSCIIHDATRGFIVMKLYASYNLLLYDYIGHGNISVMGF